MQVPEIQTERLLLRSIRIDDAEDMFAYSQDERVSRPGMWEPFHSFEVCMDFVRELVETNDPTRLWWGLESRQGGRLIGRVELARWNIRDARAELSYALSHEHWGRGLMKEATTAVADYGWHGLQLHRLEAKVFPSNEASIRLLQNLGMKYEGRLRHHQRLYGEWLDVDVYASVVDSL